MNIDDEIQKLIDKIGTENKLFPYVYLNDDEFIAGKSTVLYSSPYWSNKEVIAAIRSLLLGKWLVAGNDVRLFEKEFAKTIEEGFALLVNSGSSANLIMLAALKIFMNWKDGAEILTGAIGFPTTLAPIIQNNLKPVFLDIEMDSLNIDLDAIESKITPKTVALFLSPTLGNPPNIDKLLLDICYRNNIILILDGCDSLGSKWDNNFLSKYAVATSESLYPAHILSVGQGGIISSFSDRLIEIARSLATWGKSCHCESTQNMLTNGVCGHRFDTWLSPNYNEVIDHRYVFDYAGYNVIPLEICGSIGLEQLKKMDEIFEKRKQNYEIVSNLFIKNIKGIRKPEKLEKSDPVWFGNGIICDNKELKQKLVSYLEKNKIQTRHLFAGNLLYHKAFSHLGNPKDYPNSCKVLDLTFFTGCPPHYGKNILAYIEKVVKDF